jgi:hypothetical protein
MPDEEDTITAAEPDTGEVQSGAPETAAAEPPANPAEPQANGDAPANAAPQSQDGSLPTDSQNTEQHQPEKPAVDWEKRYRDQQSYMDRQVNQWRQRMEQQGQQMSELSKWKQEQEQRAQQAQLKPWSKAHPDNSKFNGLLERAKVIESQLRRIPATLPPEQQEAMKQAIIGALDPAEQQQIQEYRENLANFQRDFFTDPQGTLLPMVEQLAERKVQMALQKIEAQQSVQKDFTDPKLGPMVQQYKDDFAKALNDGVPYDYAKHMMGMYAELEALRNEKRTLSGKAAQADEQRRLAKGEASHTRDPRSLPQDPYTLALADAKKRGVTPDSPRFASILAKYESR